MHLSRNVIIQKCQIFKKNKNGRFIFDFFGSDLSKMDQTWSKLIKLDFLTNIKMLLYKVVTFTERIKMAVLFLIFLDQICPKWIKLDQTWSNWISYQSKNVTIKRCHIYRKDKNGCFVFDFFGSDLSKMDQTWSNLIKLDFLTNLKMLL